MAAYVRDGYAAFHQPKFECVVAKCWFLGFVVRGRTYVFSLYPNSDLDDRFFYCLLTSMAVLQADDVRASFLFVGDLNGRHQE